MHAIQQQFPAGDDKGIHKIRFKYQRIFEANEKLIQNGTEKHCISAVTFNDSELTFDFSCSFVTISSVTSQCSFSHRLHHENEN